jgi:hypothetical protein
MHDSPAPGAQAPAEIDIEKLSEKVYRLLLAEVRLERSRLGGTLRRGH